MNNRPFFIPTLDISDGKAVLVKNGDVYKILGDPFDKAEFISINSHFQIIDIDAAKGKNNNRDLIKKIVKRYPCYVGGGIRTFDDAVDLLNSSARRIIVSTELNHDLLKRIPKDRLILAFDIDDNYNVYIKGRQEFHAKKLFDLFNEFIEYAEMITITFHHKEGTCLGIPLNQIKEIKEYIQNENIRIIVAGGIKSINEISELIDLGVVPQFGSVFWNGIFTLGEVFECISKKILEKKKESLIPSIIQSDEGVNLGLVFCNPLSLKISCDTRIATFFSREREKLWIKGSTSNNYFKVKNIHYNCDGSSLRFIVNGDDFCHLGQKSCFGYNDPARGNLKSLMEHIKKKIELV